MRWFCCLKDALKVNGFDEIFFRLRAAYGKNILQNAVHGSSTSEHASVSVKKIFGDLKFAPDGTVLGSPFFTYLQMGWHVHGDLICQRRKSIAIFFSSLKSI